MEIDKYCPKCFASAFDYIEYLSTDVLYCHSCHGTISDVTCWVSTKMLVPTGDERRVLIKRDNGRGGLWIDIAWWRPSANCFDDGLQIDYWCEVPQ